MSVRILLDVPITFAVGDRTTHAPMVEVRVGATTTKLLLDTGSTDHVLTIEFARAAGLEATPGEPGVDHAGAPVPSWWIGGVQIRIGDIDLGLSDAVAITGPGPFEGWGVGGFLSPQHLHPGASVALDLVDDRVVLVEGEDDAIGAWLEARWPAMARLALVRDAGEATPVVAAAIEPFAPGPAMLNTGGRMTEFTAASVGGMRGTVPERLGHGVGGSAVAGSEIADRILGVGDATFPVPSLLIRDEIGTLSGLIGMDVLRGTVLVLSADRGRPVTWLVPTPRDRDRERGGAA